MFKIFCSSGGACFVTNPPRRWWSAWGSRSSRFEVLISIDLRLQAAPLIPCFHHRHPPPPPPTPPSPPMAGWCFSLFFPLVPRLSVRSHSVRGVTNQPANSLLSFLPSLLLLSFFLSFSLPPQPNHSIPFHSIRSDSISFDRISNLSNGTQNNGSPSITTGESSERRIRCKGSAHFSQSLG